MRMKAGKISDQMSVMSNQWGQDRRSRGAGIVATDFRIGRENCGLSGVNEANGAGWGKAVMNDEGRSMKRGPGAGAEREEKNRRWQISADGGAKRGTRRTGI